MKNAFLSLFFFIYTIAFASCSSSENATSADSLQAIADKVWAFSQSHPDGFTLDVRSMTEPTEGIAVSYDLAADHVDREGLEPIVAHALRHDGYVGGWRNPADGKYYFDSTRLVDEDSIDVAIAFGRANKQRAIYVLSTATNIDLGEFTAIERIKERGTMQLGTTGDYRPLTYREPATGAYWGYDIDVAEAIAQRLSVSTTYVPTSWPTLTADVTATPQLFDFAMGGITITDKRLETMLMSDSYLANGKTILCRTEDIARFASLSDIDQPDVRVMVNPGGLNEKFARDSLKHATIIVFEQNEEIPNRIAEGDADVMITEITEAPWYVQNDSRLAAPLLHKPFTHGHIGALMQKGQEDLQHLINRVILKLKSDGTLQQLCEKYGLSY